MADFPTYRYLNLERRWPKFRLTDLEIGAEGELRLFELPRLDSDTPPSGSPLPGLEGPAGIGVDSCGNLYAADSAGHRILRVDACDGRIAPLPCIRGPGSEPGEVNGPKGLVVGRGDTLYIADTGNKRIQLFDLATGQLRGLWERGFQQPFDLAEDGSGRLYVADPGSAAGRDRSRRWQGGRVVRLLSDGTIDPDWSLQVPQPGAPFSVAITQLASDDPASERLLVLDRQPPRLLVYYLDGTYDAEATATWSTLPDAVIQSGAVYASRAGRVYLADRSGRVIVFDSRGRLVGPAAGSDAAAGIALDREGRLVINPRGGAAVRRALGIPSYAATGTFVAGPFEAAGESTRWQRLELDIDPLPEGTHLRLWTWTTNEAGPPTDPVSDTSVYEPGAMAVAPLKTWRALPWDATLGLLLNQPGRYLWIAGLFESDGNGTPAVRQVRLVHDDPGWLRYLPALYARNDVSRVFLERALAVFETLFNREQDVIESLPRIFDPWAAPDDTPGSWLEWLADWVGTEIDEAWLDTKRRETVARAFAVFGRRGTRQTLRDLVALYTGANVYVEETSAGAGLWALNSSESALGFDTALPRAVPQGAVLARTAIVNRSTLESGDPRGRPSFEDRAHRFSVYVYSADVRDRDALESVERYVRREKPAHTSFHLCVIEPAMRVGHQGRLGVDTIVGGPPRGGAFDDRRQLGIDTVLPEDPQRRRYGTAVGERLGPATTAG